MKIKKYNNIKVFNIDNIPKSFQDLFDNQLNERSNDYIEFTLGEEDNLDLDNWFIENGAKNNELVLVCMIGTFE